MQYIDLVMREIDLGDSETTCRAANFPDTKCVCTNETRHNNSDQVGEMFEIVIFFCLY